MRDQGVPHHRLEGLDQGRAQRRRGLDQDRDVGQLGERPAGSAHDAVDRRADALARPPSRRRGSSRRCARASRRPRRTPAAHRARDSRETSSQAVNDALPAVVVGARGELGHVVGRCIALQAAQLAEVVDRVRGVARAAADAEDEQPPSALAHLGQAAGHRVDQGAVERTGELRGGLQISGAVLADRHSHNSLAGLPPKGASILRPERLRRAQVALPPHARREHRLDDPDGPRTASKSSRRG